LKKIQNFNKDTTRKVHRQGLGIFLEYKNSKSRW